MPAAEQFKSYAEERLPGWDSVDSAVLLRAVSDRIDQSLLICDEHGRLLWCNAAGHAELADKVLIACRHGLVQSSHSDRHGALSQALRDAATRGRRRLVALGRGSQRCFATVEPLQFGHDLPPAALLRMARRHLGWQLGLTLLGQMARLTPAEQRVLDGLMKGDKPAQIARNYGVAIATVRSQLTSVRMKLNACSNAELIRLAGTVVAPTHALLGMQQ